MAHCKRSRRIGWIVSLLCVGVISSVGRADLLQDFSAEYGKAAARLEEQYSHVRMVGTWKSCEWSGKLTQTTKFEMLREGNLFREISTVIESIRKPWPVGSTSITVNSEEQMCILGRKMGTADFVYRKDGPPGDVRKNAYVAEPPLTRSYAAAGGIWRIFSRERIAR